MIRAIVLSVAVVLPSLAMASGSHHLDKVDIDLSDKASLQRGARVFVNYCLNCHSAAYMRYNRMAKDLGIDEQAVSRDFLFAGNKRGDTMKVAMAPADAKRWFGTVPPDLSVVARARGSDWLYTYLRSFYLDPGRPTGVNNAVFKDVAMPHVLWELQGLKSPVFNQTSDGEKVIERLDLVQPGRLNEAEYDQFVKDLVGFLTYMGEPAKLHRWALGPMVLAFLFVFLIITYLLKKEFWKDVH